MKTDVTRQFEHVAKRPDLVSYFKNLDPQNFNIREFKEHWSEIQSRNHKTQRLALYLRQTAGTFCRMKNLQKKSQLKVYLDDNIQFWTHKASENGVDKFTPRQTAEIFWSFAKLNIWQIGRAHV